MGQPSCLRWNPTPLASRNRVQGTILTPKSKAASLTSGCFHLSSPFNTHPLTNSSGQSTPKLRNVRSFPRRISMNHLLHLGEVWESEPLRLAKTSPTTPPRPPKSVHSKMACSVMFLDLLVQKLHFPLPLPYDGSRSSSLVRFLWEVLIVQAYLYTLEAANFFFFQEISHILVTFSHIL